jgi:hypothetical protein
MAGSSEIRAGRAFVEFYLKNNLTAELDKLSKNLKDFGDRIALIGAKLAAMGTGIITPLAGAAKQFAEVGSAINDASARTGIGTDALQLFKFAAEQTGASMDDVEVGIRKMNRAIFEAEAGSILAQKSFAALGLTVADLKGKSPEDQFRKVGEKLAAMTDAGQRTALAMEIFGKSGTSLLPMIAELNEHAAQFKKLGLLIPAEDIASADRFGDVLDQLKSQVGRIVVSIGSAVATALQPFAEQTTKILAGVIAWADAHRSLVIGVLATGAALAGVGFSLIGIGASIRLIGVALTSFTPVIKTIGLGFALLTNPIALVSVALLGLAAYFVYTSNVGAKAFRYLSDKFFALKATALEAFGGIADALKAGDIGLAAQILWVGLKLIWLQGTQELQAAWARFKALFVQTAVSAFYGVSEIFTNVKASLKEAFAELTNFFVDQWHGAIQIVSGWLNDLAGKWQGDREKARIDADVASGKIAQADGERQKRDVDSNIDSVKRANDAKAKQERADRQQALAAELQHIESERQAKLKSISDSEDALSAAAKANADKEVADLTRQKAELQKQLDALSGKAAKERKSADDKLLLPPDKRNTLDDTLAARQPLEGLGTFNAAASAIDALQGDRTNDQIARNTKQTAEGIARLIQMQSTFV